MDDENNMADEIKLDPLYTIFEKHLYDFEADEENSDQLIDRIATDYIRFLSDKKVTVPGRWQPYIMDELRGQIRKMLMKKMYGCLSVEEFMNTHPDVDIKKKTARKKYKKLA